LSSPGSTSPTGRTIRAHATGDKFREFRKPYPLLGILLGIGTGWWAIHVHKVLADASSILLAMAGGDVALLAITLAAVALMSSFLQGSYGHIIQTAAGLDVFFLPFRIITCVSAAGALVCFAGAMNAGSGAEWFRAALFGLGVGLTVWTIVGAIMLTFTFIEYSIDERESATEEEPTPRASSSPT
jgi:hypothetical protein